jgi:DNA-binding NarL/FixJ family response regulator
MRDYSILFIRTEQKPAQQVTAALQEGYEGKIEWICVEALFDGLRNIRERSFDLIISDLFLPDGQGLATVRHLKQHAPQTPVIVLCHTADRDTAVNAVRKGAHDFVCYEDLDDAVKLRRAVSGALKNGAADSAERGGNIDGSGKNGADRRTNARFPCRLSVSYQALEHPFLSGVATSETLNISSKGLLFATEEALQPGQLLQVSVDWPARLENSIALKLVAEGRIVRNLNGQAAMRIDKYEFRTRRTPKGPGDSVKPATSRPEETAAGLPSRPVTAAGNRNTGAKPRPAV